MEFTMQDIAADHQSLRIVSPAYAGRAGELTAILQYVFQAIIFGEYGKQKQSKTLLKIALDEMKHLQILGTLIAKLGAPPVFTSCPPYPVGYYSASSVDYVRNPQGMLSASIRGEQASIKEYEQMLSRLKNEQVCAIIAQILEEERGHLSLLEELLSEEEKI